MISKPYVPESAGGVRWDDPAFGIEWPLDDPTEISDEDRQLAGLYGLVVRMGTEDQLVHPTLRIALCRSLRSTIRAGNSVHQRLRFLAQLPDPCSR